MEVKAPAHQDDQNDSNIDQLIPAHALNDVKVLRVVRDLTKSQPNVLSGLSLPLVDFLGLHWMLSRVLGLGPAIEDEESRCKERQYQHEEQVLDEELEKLSRADSLLLDEQVVLEGALLTVDALSKDDLGCLAVGVDL